MVMAKSSYGQVDDRRTSEGDGVPGARCLPQVAPNSPIQKSSCKRISIIVGLLVALVVIICVAVAVPLSSKNNDNKSSPRSASVIDTLCQATLYPTQCEAMILASGLESSSSDVRTIVSRTLVIALSSVSNFSQTVDDLKAKETDPDVSAALADCQSLLDDSTLNLNMTLAALTSTTSITDILAQFDDLADAMSTALTDETTCLDGFDSLPNGTAKNTLEADGKILDENLSIALALVTSFTSLGTDLSSWRSGLTSDRGLFERHLIEKDGFPTWVDEDHRRSLASSGANAVVAKDGSGKYNKIQDAVDAAPEKSTKRWVIYIKHGIYYEQVKIPSDKPFLVFVGDGIGNTVITGNLNIMMKGMTTFLSATLIVQGANFIGRDFTVRNTAGPQNEQAVALRVSADKVVLWKVALEAYQDTLYAHSHRQFYKDCLIAGTVDFMFGNGAAVLQTCKIVVRVPVPGQQNTLTAQGRTDPSQTTGLAFYNCNVNGNRALLAQKSAVATYLGRPWKEYSRAVFIRTYLGGIINPDGWLIWVGDWALKTCFFAEYQNVGPGSNIKKRVWWSRQITSASQANKFGIGQFINGYKWLPGTSVPYTNTNV